MATPTSTLEFSSHQPGAWSAVFAMSFCVFALIASEFMPVSLLTPIAASLQVSEGLAGYGIAISGALAVMTSLSMSRIAGAIDRRRVLLVLTALMGISGLLIGLANNYAVYMAGRALIGVVVGGFWSLSAAVAMRLVPLRDVPKALAIFNGGSALATVVAAPLGSYLATFIGWRGAFLSLAPLAAIVLAWQWISVPSMQVKATAVRQRSPFALLRDRLVLAGMAAVGAFFMGQFMLFTFVRPFLESVTRLDAPQVSMALLVVGVAGFIGTPLVGRVLERAGIFRTLIAVPVVMAGLAMAMVLAGASAFATSIMLGLWGLAARMAPVGWWSWLARTLPRDAETGGGLMVATIQLSIALGSAIGGLLFDTHGYRVTFMTSAFVLLTAGGLVLLAARVQRNSHGGVPA